MEQSQMLGVNFDQNPNNTKQYRTHAAWCRYLSSRGSLAENHRACTHASICKHPESRVIARRLELMYR
jgi:hypothetical protein